MTSLVEETSKLKIAVDMPATGLHQHASLQNKDHSLMSKHAKKPASQLLG
jgi:hypothetical protein